MIFGLYTIEVFFDIFGRAAKIFSFLTRTFPSFRNSEAKIRHPPYTPNVHSRCPRHVIARPILLHYPGKSPRRPPQMLQQAKVFKNTTQNTQGKETIIDKHAYTKQKSTPTQRTAMRKGEVRIPDRQDKERQEITRKTHVTRIKTIYQVAPQSRRVRRPEK